MNTIQIEGSIRKAGSELEHSDRRLLLLYLAVAETARDEMRAKHDQWAEERAAAMLRDIVRDALESQLFNSDYGIEMAERIISEVKVYLDEQNEAYQAWLHTQGMEVCYE